jgi:hypothetical protein
MQPAGAVDMEALQEALTKAVTAEVFEFRRCTNVIRSRIRKSSISPRIREGITHWPAPEEPSYLIDYIDEGRNVYVGLSLEFRNLRKSAVIECSSGTLNLPDHHNFTDLVVNLFFNTIRKIVASSLYDELRLSIVPDCVAWLKLNGFQTTLPEKILKGSNPYSITPSDYFIHLLAKGKGEIEFHFQLGSFDEENVIPCPSCLVWFNSHEEELVYFEDEYKKEGTHLEEFQETVEDVVQRQLIAYPRLKDMRFFCEATHTLLQKSGYQVTRIDRDNEVENQACVRGALEKHICLVFEVSGDKFDPRLEIAVRFFTRENRKPGEVYHTIHCEVVDTSAVPSGVLMHDAESVNDVFYLVRQKFA